MIRGKFSILIPLVLLSVAGIASAQDKSAAPPQSAAGASVPGGAPAVDPKAIIAARHVLDLTGAAKIGNQIWPRMLELLKQSQRGIPDKAWDEIDHEFQSYFSSDDFLNSIAEVYARHFSEDELKQLAVFYETPLGKRVVESLPAISQECMSIGATAGADAAQRALRRLQEKGYKPVTD